MTSNDKREAGVATHSKDLSELQLSLTARSESGADRWDIRNTTSSYQ